MWSVGFYDVVDAVSEVYISDGVVAPKEGCLIILSCMRYRSAEDTQCKV